jgi:hypothetical protein
MDFAATTTVRRGGRVVARLPRLLVSENGDSRAVHFHHSGVKMNTISSVVGLLVIVSAAALAVSLARRAARRTSATLQAADDAANAITAAQRHDLMTTSDGTRALLRAGRLVVPGRGVDPSHPGDAPRG